MTDLSPDRAGDHPVYVVAGGNHVTIELSRDESAGVFDVIEVLAQPGGGPPPHRHEFAEWFLVREGELTMSEERDGTVVCTAVLRAGDSVWVPPGVWHGTLNLTDTVTRFQAVGQPGVMSGYFVEAGVRVASSTAAPATAPPGPDQLAELPGRWGIEFWRGPVDATPPA